MWTTLRDISELTEVKRLSASATIKIAPSHAPTKVIENKVWGCAVKIDISFDSDLCDRVFSLL